MRLNTIQPAEGSKHAHHRVGRGDAAAFGDEFGLPRMRIADAVQRIFRYRTCDQRRTRLIARQPDPGFERVERAGCARGRRLAGGQASC